MPISKERKAQSRERIVAEASALFRRDGIDAVSVPALMRRAGLTHGGFYGHFSGKDDLAAAAILKALRETASRLAETAETASDPLAAIVRAYVSRAHRDRPEEGCAVAALGPEAARGPAPGRRAMVEGVEAITESLAKTMAPGRSAANLPPSPLRGGVGDGGGPELGVNGDAALRSASAPHPEPPPPLPSPQGGGSGSDAPSFANLETPETPAADDDALALFAGMIGAIVLARACREDPALSDRVLKICRDRLKRDFGERRAPSP